MNEDDVYCHHCGNDDLKQITFHGCYGSSDHWSCKVCGEGFTTHSDNNEED